MPLDNRTWLIWGIAVSIPAVASRNPWVLIELLIIVSVTSAMTGVETRSRWIVRLAAGFAAISLIFNLLTVHSGDVILTNISSDIPVIGGILTLNALVYGAISAVAILTVVMTWMTVSGHLDWTTLMRQMPDRLAPVAAAGAVAWAWLPAMQIALRDIQESQKSRGMSRMTARNLPALIVPLLAGGLERSMTTTDVLDARGFGGPVETRPPSKGLVSIVLAVTGTAAAAYLVVSDQGIPAAAVILASAAALFFGMRSLPSPPLRTRWRPSDWTMRDTVVGASAVLGTGALLIRAAFNSSTVVYSTYPTLTTPAADIVTLSTLLLLFAPAFATSPR